MNKNSLKGASLLFIGAFIWGTAFVAQSVGAEHLNAFAFNSIRNFIGAFTLMPVLLWQICTKKTDMNSVQTISTCHNSLSQTIKSMFTRDLILGGAICGVSLCVASNFQQMGLEQSTVGKSAFITTLYIVLVPLLGLFFKKKVSFPLQWLPSL